jgi:hypothetical protein
MFYKLITYFRGRHPSPICAEQVKIADRHLNVPDQERQQNTKQGLAGEDKANQSGPFQLQIHRKPGWKSLGL